MDFARSAQGTGQLDETRIEERRRLEDRSAELQQQWHGWGSPIGFGVALMSLGVFVVLLTLAWQIVAEISN